MDLSEALPIVETAIDRSSQAIVADRIKVDASVLSRWRSGATQPKGVSRERILQWAEAQSTERKVSQETPDTPPKLAGVNVTYSNSETLVAVRLAHREYAQLQNEQSWAYSVRVVNLVLESIRTAFDGAPPIGTVNGERVDRDGKLLPGELPPSTTQLAHQTDPVGGVGRTAPAKKVGRGGRRG